MSYIAQLVIWGPMPFLLSRMVGSGVLPSTQGCRTGTLRQLVHPHKYHVTTLYPQISFSERAHESQDKLAVESSKLT
jgi:hypothetical protein